jgi:predicted DNA binding CopG/RHH family protein
MKKNTQAKPGKKLTLTPEEQAIERAFARGEIVSRAVTKAEREKWAGIAQGTLAKRKAITIRISERNLARLKAVAAREGVPYQTYVSSLIQKHV